ncbi:hypothetical protein HO173_008497 [Letharia columbiana]|uniref:Uncharacterized protein n=1 Tax=Letharia columbiana TaxID=112416 RepID=A0A8H6FR76_9LECA|nr:uncharacterized protein HO173_008497 [Letharia columbiana]KAF6233208.1 hypothetical protein HO173_008497 [Letharia columbiana]
MSSQPNRGRPVRPQPPTTAPPMIQAQQPQSYFTPNPYGPHPTQLQQPFQPPPGPPPQQLLAPQPQPPPQASSPPSRKRKAPGSAPLAAMPPMPSTSLGEPNDGGQQVEEANEASSSMPPPKKSRTNTPWTPAEEQRLKIMRDAGNSWGEIAKTFPNRTEGSVKKHWYKDMHYADFAEDDSAALLAAIKEYEASKWKAIGQKVGKPAKACEQYAKEHFGNKV